MLAAILVGALLTAVAQAQGDEARLEQSGTMTTSAGGEVPQFVVVIGHPQFDDTRAPLVPLVGLYQANAIHWIHRADGVWVRLEYKVPMTRTESAALDTRGLEAIALRRELLVDELPTVVRDLPQSILENIGSLLQFYSGAFRIYLRDQSEARAAEMAAALNRRTTTPDTFSSSGRARQAALDQLMAQAEAAALIHPQCAEAKREATDLALQALGAPPELSRELIQKISKVIALCTRPATAY